MEFFDHFLSDFKILAPAFNAEPVFFKPFQAKPPAFFILEAVTFLIFDFMIPFVFLYALL